MKTLKSMAALALCAVLPAAALAGGSAPGIPSIPGVPLAEMTLFESQAFAKGAALGFGPNSSSSLQASTVNTQTLSQATTTGSASGHAALVVGVASSSLAGFATLTVGGN
jgi:hypothetical protein